MTIVRKIHQAVLALFCLFSIAVAQHALNDVGSQTHSHEDRGNELYTKAMDILSGPEYQERQIIMTDSSQIYRSARVETRYSKFLDVAVHDIKKEIFWNGLRLSQSDINKLLHQQDNKLLDDGEVANVSAYTKITEEQLAAYNYLVEAATQYNHLDSLYELSQLHLWNDYGFVGDKMEGFKYLLAFDKVCLQNNYPRNESVLFQIGVGYSTGLFTKIPDHMSALAYYQTAADMGDIRSIQALAHRYHMGSGGVPKNCVKAQMLYSTLAEALKIQIDNTKTHNLSWDVLPIFQETYNIRVCDLKDGLLGESDLSSVFVKNTKTRLKAKLPNLPGYGLNVNENSLDEAIDNLQDSEANAGGAGGFNLVIGFSNDMAFNFNFGEGKNEFKNDQLIYQYYDALNAYEGTFFFQKNATYALEILTGIYKTFDKYADSDFNEHQKYFYSKALDLLGRILLTGEVINDENYELSKLILVRAVEVMEHPVLLGRYPSRANVDLALIAQYIEGNYTKAEIYYKKIIDTPHDDGVAAYNLAKLRLEQEKLQEKSAEYSAQRDVNIDLLIQKAVVKGFDPALYMWTKTRESSEPERFRCEDIVRISKLFVERMEPLLVPYLKKSFTKYINNDNEAAIWGYAMAAEQGYEPAQTSVAFMLVSPLLMFEDFPQQIPEHIKKLAISYYVRAYKQNNVDAGLVAGDMYYREGDYESAAALYQGTSTKFSAQGLWNLGYMYEAGLGVEKDYHLAKRYYEQVLESQPLYIAIKLSVLKLQLKSLWESFSTWSSIDEKKYLAPIGNYIKLFVKRTHANIEQLQKYFTRKSSANLSKFSNNYSVLKVSNILTRLEIYGVDADVLSFLLIVGLFMLLPTVVTRLAVRYGWNVVVNGVQINPPPQPIVEETVLPTQPPLFPTERVHEELGEELGEELRELRGEEHGEELEEDGDLVELVPVDTETRHENGSNNADSHLDNDDSNEN